jgi:hypothetical protein
MAYRLSASIGFCAGVALAALAVPAVALAQQAEPAPNPQAEQLNDQGKELYKNKDFQGAAAKFREANSIQPDARYYFNLCATLEKAGDLNGALEACDTVYSYTPNDELKAKTGQRAASIRQAIRQQQAGGGTPPGGGDTGQGGPGTPGGGTPTGGDVGAGGPGGPPPPPEVVKSAPGEFNWAFGGEVGPIVATTFFPDANVTSDTGGFMRLYADKSFGAKFAGRAFLGFGGYSIADEFDSSNTATVGIFEAGVAGYTQVKLANNIFLSPTVGLQVASIDVSSDFGAGSSSASTFGMSAGLPISLLFGNGKHAIYVDPVSISYYFPTAASDTSDEFDGGLTYMITFGYQMRWQKGEKLPGFVVLE